MTSAHIETIEEHGLGEVMAKGMWRKHVRGVS